MVKTEMLESITCESKIIKEFVSLSENILGYYCFDGDYHFILINENLKNNERIYRIVLAEELGHYYTTVGDITPHKYMCYRDRLQVDKKELLALKWAVDFLIPTEILLDKFKERAISNIAEIADMFLVTEAFVTKKFEFMSKQKSIWKIDETYNLCLYNLPSIYTYSSIV